MSISGTVFLAALFFVAGAGRCLTALAFRGVSSSCIFLLLFIADDRVFFAIGVLPCLIGDPLSSVSTGDGFAMVVWLG